MLEAFADRRAVDQVFRDVKKVWGNGQRRARNQVASGLTWSKDRMCEFDDDSRL